MLPDPECTSHPRLNPLWLAALLIIFVVATPFVCKAAHVAADSPQQLLAAGRADDAIQALQQRITQSPADAESYNLLCRAYFMLEEWDRGIAACEHARNLDPQNSLYHLWLGRIYGEKADRAGFLSAAGLAKKVRVSFERAVELDPGNWEARTDLAEFYLEAPGIVGGGKDKARAQADALMPLNPGMAHWVAGRLAEKEKDLVTAEREYRAAVSVSHSGARECLDLASFLRRSDRLDEMEETLRKLETAALDHPPSLIDGANMLLRTGRNLPLAIRLLRRYLASPVEDGPAFWVHALLGEALEKQGNHRAAVEEYRAALSLNPNYSRAQQDLKRMER